MHGAGFPERYTQDKYLPTVGFFLACLMVLSSWTSDTSEDAFAPFHKEL
jgi:hypothetical protein